MTVTLYQNKTLNNIKLFFGTIFADLMMFRYTHIQCLILQIWYFSFKLNPTQFNILQFSRLSDILYSFIHFKVLTEYHTY